MASRFSNNKGACLDRRADPRSPRLIWNTDWGRGLFCLIGPYAPLTMVTSNNSRLRFYWGRFFARGREGGHRMTDKIEACATVLYDAAMERAQDDPDLARRFRVVL